MKKTKEQTPPAVEEIARALEDAGPPPDAPPRGRWVERSGLVDLRMMYPEP